MKACLQFLSKLINDGDIMRESTNNNQLTKLIKTYSMNLKKIAMSISKMIIHFD